MHFLMWGFWLVILGLAITGVVLLARGNTANQRDGPSPAEASPGSSDGPIEHARPRLGPEELSLLDPGERTLYELVARDEDIYQKDLPELTGFSKAKVSRLLDKLEHKGLVQRLSHGMTNRVILAHGKRS